MPMQEAVEQYQKALKLGRKCYKDAVIHGSYPYLPALDDCLVGPSTAGVSDLGVLEIPMEMVVGTRTDARKNAFAANFMPWGVWCDIITPFSRFTKVTMYVQTTDAICRS